MIRTPKERFVASTFSGQWGKITSSEVYEEAIHTALGQLQSEMPEHCDVPQQACDAHQQMIGARRYMRILSELYVKDTSPKTNPRSEIDYRAGV